MLPSSALSPDPNPAGQSSSGPRVQSGGQEEERRETARKINREVVLLLGWGRAILLQLAHPLVASGVADHSSFDAAPKLKVRRLVETIQAMLALTFGSPAEIKRAAAVINAIHDRVHGQLQDATQRRAAGTPYSAHDPELLSWVHMTLLDSLLIVHERFVGPLSVTEKDQFCQEARMVEPLLGMPAGTLPGCFEDLLREMDQRMKSGEIEVTPTARRLAREVVSPKSVVVFRPLIRLATLPAVGLLPVSIREAYGYRWNRLHQMLLVLGAKISRFFLPCLPGRIRYWPEASHFWFPILRACGRYLSPSVR